MREVIQTEFRIRKLLSAITNNNDFLWSPPDEKLSETGLESVGMIELIHTLSDQFRTEFSDEEVVPKNFDSIRSVTRLVESKNETV